MSTRRSGQQVQSGGVELTNSDVTPFASKKVGGGTWEYGTKKSGGYKTAYSYYWHPTKTHGASDQVGAKKPNRDCVTKDKVARAEKKRKSNETAYVYWNTTCKLK
ncbi:lactococcin 972 family bacteriocin [Kroppenstedtia eburnea]|uniref:lactococcin 972 family bacteriocin n=1 Tax=Kroppenstedtia eburnea TaxID=714067 RepID=UPI00097030A6